MNQKTLISVLAVIILILGGTTVYLLTAQKNVAPAIQTPMPISKTLPAPEKTSPVVQSSPAVPAVQDEAANWKTYENSSYGYSFQYPNTDWFIYGDTSDVKNAGTISIAMENAQDRSHLIEVSTKNLQLKIDEAVEMYKNSVGYKKSQIVFMGIDTTQIDHTQMYNNKKISDGKAIIFSKNGKTYYLDGIVRDYEKVDADTGIFNTILESFKFTK